MFNLKPRLGRHRIPQFSAYQGDTIQIPVEFKIDAVKKPITNTNTVVRVVLANHRYDDSPIWTGDWNNFTAINKDRSYYNLELPQYLSESLRAGLYIISIVVSDTALEWRKTMEPIYLELKYAPTSPLIDIPYPHS